MKPHGIRRILWLGALVAGAGAAAAGAHHIMKVRPATAKTLDRHPKDIEKRWKDMARSYTKRAQTSTAFKPTSPVVREQLMSVLLKYDDRNPHWFPYVGPKAPPVKEPEPAKPDRPPPPKGLAAMGDVSSFMYPTSILFKFNGEKAGRTIAVGEFVKKSATDADRFKLIAMEPVRDARRRLLGFDVMYEVYNAKGEREGDVQKQRYDLKRTESTGVLRYKGEDAAAGVTQVDPGGSTTEAGEAAKPGEIEAGAVEASAGGPDERVTKPIEQLTAEDLRPRILVSSDRRQKAVVFDGNTRAYFKHKSVDQIANSIKTTPERDARTGRVVGLRLDFGQETAAQALDVKRGDILISINDRPAGSRAQVIEIVKTLSEEKVVKVVIERAAKQLTYHVDPRDPRVRRQARYFENLR